MILIVENYLSEHVCADIRKLYDAGLRDGSVRPKGRLDHKTDVSLSAVWPNVGPFVDGIVSLLCRHFWLSAPVLDYCAYTRMLPGSRHELHADAHRLDGSPNHTPNRVATAMVYLSDSGRDFSGGVMRFPELGVEVQPKPGLLVGFPTNLRHQHEVSVVADGVRDAVATWFK